MSQVTNQMSYTIYSSRCLRGGQVKQMEGEEDQGERVHQDQENVQHGLRVFPESSLELPN